MNPTHEMLSSEEGMTAWIAASTWLAGSFALIVVAVVTLTYGVLYRVFRGDDPGGAEVPTQDHEAKAA